MNDQTKKVIRRSMTVSDLASPLDGCCAFFDNCNDNLMSLSFQGQLGFLDWLNWQTTEECYRTVEFITYQRPTYSTGSPTAGYLSDPCADPNGVEYGSAKITVEDFGRYGRVGPDRDMMRPKMYCKQSPRYRLDGTLISDEREWDIRFATEVLLQDIRRHVITGNSGTPGQFDGLERWVKTGYSASILDANVIDWNGNDFGGGAGITWNGNAVGATYNFINVLLDAYRRIKTRISWAPMLMSQNLAVGDMIILLPTHMINCLLNSFTCWSVCPGAEFNEVSINNYEARTFRDRLNGGMFGFGSISLDGFTIPLMAYDWELIKSPSLSDIYLLTGSVGSQRIWTGEHVNAPIEYVNSGQGGYFSLDGGRILGLTETENLCTHTKVWMRPRLFCMAPFLQARFQDVKCTDPGGPLSPDPLETSFYPLTSFAPAECP